MRWPMLETSEPPAFAEKAAWDLGRHMAAVHPFTVALLGRSLFRRLLMMFVESLVGQTNFGSSPGCFPPPLSLAAANSPLLVLRRFPFSLLLLTC